MDGYALLKALHLIGAVILLGNIVVTAWWKVMADRTRDPRVIAFAQRQVTLTDFLFTAGGVALLAGSGYAMVFNGPWTFDTAWIDWGQSLFLATGLVWVGILIPIQWRQARMARGFAGEATIPAAYWRLSAWWLRFGTVAIVLPLAALFLMVLKPV